MTDFMQAAADAMARFNAMPAEARQAMRAAQRASFIRGMTTPCEHGILDFEQCGDCREPATAVLLAAAVIIAFLIVNIVRGIQTGDWNW